LGNLYLNKKYQFSLERPSADWHFITEQKDLKGLNSDATVALELEDRVYSMVIVEKLPGVSLEKYARLVTPSLEDIVLLSDEKAKISGLPARKRIWQGKHDELLFRFFCTLIARGDMRFQIVSWCVDSGVNKKVRDQIGFIENSFKILGPKTAPPSVEVAEPKPVPEPSRK